MTGVFYGISHRRTLQKAHDEEVRKHAVHEREHLIAQAKEAWKKKQEPPKAGDGESLLRALPATLRHTTTTPLATVVTDPEDPRFDLEKLIAKWETESA